MTAANFLLKTVAVLISPVRYVGKGVEHVKDHVREDVEGMIARVMKLAVLLVTGFLFFLFFGLVVANLLNNAFESPYIGYVFVTGFYFVVLLVLLITKNLDSKKLP